MQISGKTALVTGGAHRVGKAIVMMLAQAGANVVVNYNSSAQAAAQTVDEAKALGVDAVAIQCNIANLEDVQHMRRQVEAHFGGVDILVNNAATNPVFGPIMFCEEWAWDKIMEVNLKGYFFMAKACLPHMQSAGKGVIINVASTAGLDYAQGMGVYSISKAGVIMLTKTLASEWGTFNIRVNSVAPGLFKTKFSQALWATDEILEQVLDTQKIKKLAEPEDIADAVLFAASDKANFMTG